MNDEITQKIIAFENQISSLKKKIKVSKNGPEQTLLDNGFIYDEKICEYTKKINDVVFYVTWRAVDRHYYWGVVDTANNEFNCQYTNEDFNKTFADFVKNFSKLKYETVTLSKTVKVLVIDNDREAAIDLYLIDTVLFNPEDFHQEWS
jgi:hypothetical protein